eukprot:5349109-Amphidinium_carterae.2
MHLCNEYEDNSFKRAARLWQVLDFAGSGCARQYENASIGHYVVRGVELTMEDLMQNQFVMHPSPQTRV